MITKPEKKAAPDFRVDVKLRDVLVNSSETRNRSQAAIAVEEANGVAGAGSQHRGKVVSLGAAQLDITGGQPAIDVKSIGHVW